MIELYVLDGDLNRIGIIDSYTSLIWANRYSDEGDCELYVQAAQGNLNLLKKGYYLARNDDDMVCRIERVELDTSVEDGDYIVVTGIDVKKILSQRIIWSQMNVDGSVEQYIRTMIYKSLVNPNLSARAVKNESGRQNFFLGDPAGFTEVITEQATYTQVSEKVKELCKKYQWGYKVIVDHSVKNFYFVLYAGEDRSDNVKFSPQFENLASTKYIEDSSNLANVALVAGEGEGSDRARNVSGYAESLDRYELYVDARDISKTITYEELTTMYPLARSGGQGYIDGTLYKMGYINIPIVDENQLTELRQNYPNGEVIYISGIRYYRTYDPIIADLTKSSPQPNDSVILRPLIYEIYLLNRGYEKLSEYGSVVSFEGSVEPDITFTYKDDYFLGDVVTVENEYGIEVEARIVEVVEVCDENGYDVQPKFEYAQIETAPPSTRAFLLAESGDHLTTENGEFIELENSVVQPPVMRSKALAASPNNVNNDEPVEYGSKKISELPESTDLYEGCCLPVVTYGETKKLTYALLKARLAEDLNISGGVPAGGSEGDLIVKKSDEDYDVEWKPALSNSEIEALINNMV